MKSGQVRTCPGNDRLALAHSHGSKHVGGSPFVLAVVAYLPWRIRRNATASQHDAACLKVPAELVLRVRGRVAVDYTRDVPALACGARLSQSWHGRRTGLPIKSIAPVRGAH